MAQWIPMVFYPGTWLLCFGPVWYLLPVFMIGHLILGGLGMHRLIFQQTSNHTSACIVGFSFAFSGIPLGLLGWPSFCAGFGWAPWVIAALLKTTRLIALPVILIASLQLLTGSPEIIICTWFIGFSYYAVLHRQFKIPLFNLAGAISLCSIQILPFLVLLLNSNRLSTTFVDWSLTFSSCINFIAPYYNTVITPYGLVFPKGQYWLTTYYIPMGLVALPFISKWQAGYKPYGIWLGLACVSICLALGSNCPGVHTILAFTPLCIIRYSIKFVILFTIVLHIGLGLFLANFSYQLHKLKCLLVGLAICMLYLKLASEPLATTHNFSVRILFGIGFCCVLFLSGKPNVKVGILLCFLGLDVVTHAPLMPTIPIKDFLATPANSQMHAIRLGQRRLQRAEVEQILSIPSQDHKARIDILSRDRNLLASVPSAGGFYPLYLKYQQDLTSKIYFQEICTNWVPNYFDFIGIHTQINPQPLITIGQQPISGTNSIDLTLQTDLKNYVIVNDPKSLPTNITASIAKVTTTEINSHSIKAYTETTNEAYMVLAQAWYPAWQATIDGRPVPLLRVNTAFQAIQVPKGKHHVEVYYQDLPFLIGISISSITLVILMSLILIKFSNNFSIYFTRLGSL